MKKLFTILCAGVLSLGVSAQTQFGVTAGLNMANISASEKYDEVDGIKMGVHVGISADIPLSDAMTLKTGALFSMKGAEETADIFGISVTGTYSLSYIEIPMNLSFAVSDQMSLIAGPYMGFLMGAESELLPVSFANSIGYESKSDITADVAAMDFGINLGASFAVTEVVSINAGYQIGLTELYVDGSKDTKSTNIHIGMTYSFGG